MQTLVLGGTENKHTHTHGNTLITHILLLVCSRLEQVWLSIVVNRGHYTSNASIITPVWIHTSGFGCSVGVARRHKNQSDTCTHTHTHTASRSDKTKATADVLTLKLSLKQTALPLSPLSSSSSPQQGNKAQNRRCVN